MDKVSEIMIKEIVCCTPKTKIEDSKSIMEKYDCSKIPVVNTLKEMRVIGIVDRSDLDSDVRNILECMSRDLRAIEVDSTVDECLRVMIMNNEEQLPVLDKQGHLCGMVTEKNIIKIKEGL